VIEQRAADVTDAVSAWAEAMEGCLAVASGDPDGAALAAGDATGRMLVAASFAAADVLGTLIATLGDVDEQEARTAGAPAVAELLRQVVAALEQRT
jgi:hypothetical protein